MAQSGTVFVRAAGGDWLQMNDCRLSIDIRRRLTRTVARDGEGDDLTDEGAESAVYTLEGAIGAKGYREMMAIFRTGTAFLLDPFEEREVKAVFSEFHYESDTGAFRFEFIEDVV